MRADAPGAAYEAIEAATKQAVEFAITARARAFALEPSLLEGIEPGLSKKSPRRMHEALISLIDGEMTRPLRWYGFDGGSPLINLNGALHYADQLVSIIER